MWMWDDDDAKYGNDISMICMIIKKYDNDKYDKYGNDKYDNYKYDMYDDHENYLSGLS